MSGFAPQSPTSLDTTDVQSGQPPASISAASIQLIVDSLSGYASTTQIGNFTLTQAMRGTRVRYNSATPGIATIPTNANTVFTIGSVITFCQIGTGQLTLAAAAGVTLLSPSTNATVMTRTANSHIWIIQDTTNVWIVGGDIT